MKESPAEPTRTAPSQPCSKEGEEELKCFRCGGHTSEGIFIHLERQGSPAKPETHPICSDCAVEFWRWADEPRTILTHERVLAKRGELEERERRLREREAEVKKMTRKLEKELDLRELEVVGRVR
ncbi:MAG: hypothetical protein OEY99_00565 [Aigarchaeota archaeon]|nr:hypothetical protein [Aigarchaeota archaeon]MDH5702685.1 hypothetical protein [Aigarchaeota archaeon]